MKSSSQSSARYAGISEALKSWGHLISAAFLCVYPLLRARFPRSQAKVVVIYVDTPGRDVSVPKGIFVQWQ